MLAAYAIVPLLLSILASPLLHGKRTKHMKYLALAASLASLALSLYVSIWPSASGELAWFSVGGYRVSMAIALAPLNDLLLLLVALITPLIMLYSIGFMRVPSEQQRYYAELCAFAASMMLFSMSGNFITLFVSWEFLGITSYLLIGFWYWRDGAARAARKAITTILAGDMALLAAIILIWATYHTLDFAALSTIARGPAMGYALALIAIAAFTKSAQFPFHEWLPDAMAGPTPVSAFLHSSTMVKAGVFAVMLLLTEFSGYRMLNVFLFVGIVSAVLGATNALAETHIKRILAYSTIEDLGLMFVALGLNAIVAAALFFFVQTFYKALLFMCAGALMESNDGSDDIRAIKSTASLPLFASALIGAASLAGMFPTSGFLGKLGIDMSATNVYVYLSLLAIEVLSSAYIFRWLIIPIVGSNEEEKATARLRYASLPQSMKVPIYLLAASVFAASAAFAYLPAYLSPHGGHAFAITAMDASIETLMALLGAAAAYYLLGSKRLSGWISRRKYVNMLLRNSVFINYFYAIVSAATLRVANSVDDFDYYTYKAIRRASAGIRSAVGGGLRLVEGGQVNNYILISAVGLAILMLLFVV